MSQNLLRNVAQEGSADMKDIQGQMRHSRMSTTADIYVQDIPESRRRAVEKLPLPTIVQ